ncbi:MAG: DUF748 domain-containing protein [Syntrophaceae bacterium]|nr:DUF748 domain-containing protein [Syntrophaceae bacterium]
MKKWLIIVGIIALFFIGGYFVVSFYAVKFIEARLQRVVGPGFTMAEIKIRPTYLSARGIRYEDPLSKRRFFSIEEMRIYPALLSFLKGTLLEVRECAILGPSAIFYRSQEGHFIGPWTAMGKKEKAGEIPDKKEKKEKESVRIKIDRFRIKKGSVDFEDEKVGGRPPQIRLRDVDLEIKNVQYPFLSIHSPIELKGKMKGREKDGSFSIKGWIDLRTMDMATWFKLQEIEVKTFEPYYRKKVSAEIESGRLDLEAKIDVKQKMIDAPGQLELIDLRIKEEGTVLWIPAKALLSLLKQRDNRIQLRFHVKGNIDDPQFSLQETFFTRIALSLAETLGIPIKVVGETVLEGTTKGIGGIVEGLKSFEKMFKKKKER